jgi:3-dehydroquinate synthase
MSDVISVTAEQEYDVLIGCNWRDELSARASDRTRCAIVTTESMKAVIGNLQAGDCEFVYCIIPDGEEGKSPEVLLKLWNWLAAAGFTRTDVVVGVGGGAITDIAGFAAATYLRGIDWIAIPTSVAGSVDAAIGGKTGANLDYGKNLVGSFHSPRAVLVDHSWFATLSDRDFSAGLAEVIKCGFIRDAQILQLMGNRDLQSIRKDDALVLELIRRAVQVKADVVSGDFKESFDREILNYGHTFGHAVEKHAKYSLRHGECVAIGMAFMAHLQSELGLITDEVRDLHLTILTGIQLPITYSAGDWPELRALMSMDKKSRGNTLRFVTITEIGKTDRIADVAQAHLVSAYEKVCS